jgi:P-type Cu+ transporter
LVMVFIVTVSAFAVVKKPVVQKKGMTKATVSAVCPVMGTKIPDVTKAAGKSVYKGKTYYFCCPGCKPAFDKNPEKYIDPKTGVQKNLKMKPKAMQSAVCPVMGTKIPDVSKASGKSVYKGKTYYFCCPSCKPAFDKNPEKYVNKKPVSK